MDRAAYTLRPSSASIWSVCPGHIRMAARFPEVEGDNEVREEGTAFHQLIQAKALGEPVGDHADNGVQYTEDMHDHCAEWLDLLRSLPVTQWNVEVPMAIPLVHPECGGTPDIWGIDWTAGTVYLLDAKYGHRPVDPFQLKQLVCYAAGILGQFDVYPMEWKVVCVIFQPRVFDKPQFWNTTAATLRPLIEQLHKDAVAALDPDAMLRAGTHCLDCSAAGNCDALRIAGIQTLDVIARSSDDGATDAAVAFELELLERAESILKARREGLELRGMHRIKQGAILPGYTVAESTTRTRWNEGSEVALIEMCRTLGLGDIARPPKAVTPKQAEAIIGEKLVKQFSHRPTGKMKLKRLSQKAIAKAFEG